MNSTLWQLNRGESCVITGFDEVLRDDYRTRLVELGFRPGAEIVCVVAPRLGAPRLYRVASTVYSLEQQLAERVHIEGASP